MGDPYLDVRLTALRGAQNPDGGWGYFRGKQSWIEPTAYSALALHGDPAADRAWKLLKSWQTSNGSWRPSADVHIESWATALCVTLASVRGEFDDPFQKGAAWLAGMEGIEVNLLGRTAAKVGLFNPGRNLKFHGWPWKPNTSSWVEPTAHTLVALKHASRKIVDKNLLDRISIGEGQLLDVRCSDGGWNYGSRAARDIDLPSYPETTALALVGLQENPDAAKSLEVARRMARESVSPLANAWMSIALRLHGADVAPLSNRPSSDILITALEALTCANYKFFKTGGPAQS